MTSGYPNDYANKVIYIIVKAVYVMKMFVFLGQMECREMFREIVGVSIPRCCHWRFRQTESCKPYTYFARTCHEVAGLGFWLRIEGYLTCDGKVFQPLKLLSGQIYRIVAKYIESVVLFPLLGFYYYKYVFVLYLGWKSTEVCHGQDFSRWY